MAAGALCTHVSNLPRVEQRSCLLVELVLRCPEFFVHLLLLAKGRMAACSGSFSAGCMGHVSCCASQFQVKSAAFDGIFFVV